MDPVRCVIERWTEEADLQRRRYLEEGRAHHIMSMIQDMEEALEAQHEEVLSLDEAADESGYTEGHLKRLIREGRIPNAGSDADPAILRRYLPRKPGCEVLQLNGIQGLSRCDLARDFLESVN